MQSACYWQNGFLFLRLHVQPNAKKTQWAGPYADRLKLKLHAPAVEGKANQALIDFLSDFLKLKKSQIALISGELSRDKLIKIAPPVGVPSEWIN